MTRALFLAIFLCTCLGEIQATQQPQVEEGRLLITREQVHLTPEGIFINLQGHFVRVDSIHATSNGNYYCAPSDWLRYCPNGHPYLPWQTGCSIESCPYYGH